MKEKQLPLNELEKITLELHLEKFLSKKGGSKSSDAIALAAILIKLKEL